MHIGFSDKQLKILQFGYSDYDALIADGTIRSGKTSVISIAFILWAMNNFRNKNFIIGSKSVTSAVRNIIQPLLQVKYLHQQFEIRYLTTQNLLKVTRGNKTNYFYVFGGKDEASYQTVQGITSAGCFLDEVALMPQSFFNQVLARCSVDGSKYWFSSNPEGPEHWYYQEWIQKADEKNALYLHFTMDDNPSLSEAIKERYKRLYSGVFYQRYILGLWVRAEGAIYTKYVNEPQKFHIKKSDFMKKRDDNAPFDYPRKQDIILINAGVDFGGTQSAHAFVATGYTRGMKHIIGLIAERIPDELSPEELEIKFALFCEKVWRMYGKAFNTRCDNAEPVLIRGLKNIVLKRLLRTNVKNALKKEIKSRIDVEMRLLGEERLWFIEEDTVPLQLAFRDASWSKKKADTRLDDGTSDIDILDAFEYSFEEYSNNLIDGASY